MSEIELLPCPFCGSKRVKIIREGSGWNSGVECKECELDSYFFKKGHNVGRDPHKPIQPIVDCWNTRADRWIPVSERLPELEEDSMQSEWVLVTNGERIVESYYYDYTKREPKPNYATGKGWCRHGISKFTHWKPITLPKAGE